LTAFKTSQEPGYVVEDSKLYHKNNQDNLAAMKYITRISNTYKEENKAIAVSIANNQ